ncbi:MAG TPA: sigma-70 family RNA polymerase sigma factor [Gemmataceae bacterium]|nr:sigma-70 family RNA polymerase sigma factor [Gemmataceae bacterium]
MLGVARSLGDGFPRTWHPRIVTDMDRQGTHIEQPGAANPAQAGPPPTIEEVFRDHAPRIYNLALRMLGNEADAEDVTQEVLLQLVRKLDTFRGESAFPTWLHRITVNAALAYRRKRASREQHHVHDPLDTLFEEGKHAAPVRNWWIQPDKAAVDKETQRLIEQAIAGLPEIYRDVYVLADVEGLANSEIADMLGLSVPAVKSRLHRARLLMRSALAPHFEEVPA